MNMNDQKGFIPSDIPESLELDVMNFIVKNTVYAVKENVYVIDDVANFASELIRKYKIKI